MDLTNLLLTLDHNSPLFYLVLLVWVLSKTMPKLLPILEHHLSSAKLDRLTKRHNFVLAKAKVVVANVSEMAGLTNVDRLNYSVDKLDDLLREHGIEVSRHDLEVTADSAYKYMKANGYLKDVPVKTTDVPENLTDEQLKQLIPEVNAPKEVNAHD